MGAMRRARPYELVLYGASGYTGRQAAAYVAARAPGLGLRWAIAGRDGAKLARLAHGLPGAPPPILLADGADRTALTSLAAQTRVVVSLVGPHGPVGDGLLAGCVEAGTDYADLCGENDVIERRLHRLAEPARAARVRLLSACGFESLPFDLAVLALDEAFRATDGSRVVDARATVGFLFDASPLRYAGAVVSRGTLATLVALTDAGELRDPQRFATAASTTTEAPVQPPTRPPSRPPVRVPARPPSPLVHPSARPPSCSPAHTLELAARRDAHGAWLAPLLPTPFLNPAIVHLTGAQLTDGPGPGGGYAAGFEYGEALDISASLSGSRVASLSSLPALLGARGCAALGRRIAALAAGERSFRDRATLAVLRALAARVGEGPRESSLDGVHYRIELWARSDSALAAGATIDGRGHPGYRSSPNIVAEVGILLAREDALPERYGVLTPASALGTAIHNQLAAAGLTFTFPSPARAGQTGESPTSVPATLTPDP